MYTQQNATGLCQAAARSLAQPADIKGQACHKVEMETSLVAKPESCHFSPTGEEKPRARQRSGKPEPGPGSLGAASRALTEVGVETAPPVPGRCSEWRSSEVKSKENCRGFGNEIWCRSQPDNH